ncbi:MAG TPA: N-acetylmuramoyl-L-alanine amidase [Candidatus Hydrogenedentes bacterium]|nr:N-acetylmuramoyl-L-alanine amidase [Candidatus Hydrogenedentota bacterium]
MPFSYTVTSRGRFLCVLCLLSAMAMADPPEIRVELEPSVTAVLQGGVKLCVECALPPGGNSRELLGQLMANPSDWRFFLDRSQVEIPYSRLNPATQRRVLQAVFPGDSVDGRGWRHVVTVDGPDGTESPFALAEWLTGRGTNASLLRLENGAALPEGPLRKGMVLIMPYAVLLPHMRPTAGSNPTPAVSSTLPPPQPPVPAPTMNTPPPDKADTSAPPPPPPVEEAIPAETNTPVAATEDNASSAISTSTDGNGGLSYGQDKTGRYAEYHLQPGESLYTAVVIRFTDIRDHAEILKACDEIRQRSGIRDINRMPAGQRVRIPLEMLSAEYLPEDAPQRREFEAVRQKAKSLRGKTPRTRNLKGVLVVIDPGHGGMDPGTHWEDIYEDEVVYDIACRLKEILESRSAAKTEMTRLDESQRYVPVSSRKFSNDSDEYVLVNPRYHITNTNTSVNLRWALANSIYRKERAAGTASEKIVFLSIHVDSIKNPQVRGTTVYVPAAHLMDTVPRLPGSFRETKDVPASRFTREEAQTHEAMSRNLAEQIILALRKSAPPIATLSHGDPVRNTILKEKRPICPAVLKKNLIPTKVLVEIANIQNPGDRALLSDPAWRQRYAEALYTALCRYFE